MASNPCANAIKSGDHLAALPLCEQAAQAGGDAVVAMWFHLVEIHHVLGQDEQESYYLAKIKTHPQFIENIEHQYNWYRRVGQKHYHMDQFDSSAHYLSMGLSIAEQENNPQWLSKSHNDMGLVAYRQKDHVTSLEHFNRSLNLKWVHGNAYQVGNTLNNIARVQLAMEKPDLAIDFYEQALEQYLAYTQETDFDERVYQQISHIYEDLTRAHNEAGDVQAAQSYADQILSTFRLKKSPRAQARALQNLAVHHLGIEQPETARLFLTEAQSIQYNHGLQPDAEFHLAAASLAWDEQDWDAVTQWTDQGLALASAASDHRLLSGLYELKARLTASSDAAQALAHYQSHMQHREQFLQDKYDRDLNTIQHRIEKQNIQHELVNQQLISTEKTAEVQRLTNGVLWASLVLLAVGTAFLFYAINKRRERKALLQSIKHHEQQLFMLQDQQLPLAMSSNDLDHNALKQSFQQQLVVTLVDALTTWEKTTGTDRIELAEKSKVWTVSIDNGTLRTRSLDKYLDIDKIPANPRWRNVVKTCHYVLTLDQLQPDDRMSLESQLSQLLDLAKQLSLCHG
ncbi:tetratricopeptide repeat protein [Marinicella meishanensis]|uniref:tetratricopeptide repeat protein n=1 Tax=Marinicella meishanensis TaxID=2873263 RepID=UPI001CBB14A4|nr:tetratricopeptide repeat protein [Marinicella sp. NBU2979]